MPAAHLRLNATQKALHDADEGLAAAGRAVGSCRAAIHIRPLEAAKRAQVAADAIAAARKGLLDLFDTRVDRDTLYGKPSC